jgi:hypothetical protein
VIRIRRLTAFALLGLLVACSTPSPSSTDLAVRGVVVAGPTCPVVTDPPDPSCADRPVSGAELIVLTSSGAEVMRATSDADGIFVLHLPPGGYVLEPQPVEGLLGTANPVAFSVDEAGAADLVVSYDTGIR